ncbi:MAG: hypothetical protein GX804_02585 [Lentisphaerae bacterium]|nr:hypothetical protein [Lentisphaerota bacterium]
MIDQSMLEKVREAIRKAGYEYASTLYSYKCESWVKDTTPTKQDVYDSFNEHAWHEGIQFKIWETFEANEPQYVSYLEALYWQEIVDLFSEGGFRRIDEIL